MKTLFPIALIAGVLSLAGCGGESDGGPEATPPPPATTVETTTPDITTDTTTAPTTTAPAAPRTIVMVVDQGRPRGGIKRPKLEKGEKVVLVVKADVGESVHMHGYDIEKPVTPAKPVRIPLTATIPGRFELELHNPDSLLAVIEVRP
jgi:hypothetical protein